jgi:hypothetical protein
MKKMRQEAGPGKNSLQGRNPILHAMDDVVVVVCEQMVERMWRRARVSGV